MVLPTRVRSLRRSTWLACGSSPSSSAARVSDLQVHAWMSMSMAANAQLPDNKYGMGTSAARSSAITEYYKRGQYIPGLKINGMDVLAVKAAVAYGKEYCRQGKGPLVYEYVTYRYGGHSMSDPGTTYRTREEIQRMRSTNDPIAGLKQKILEWEVASEEELKSIDKKAREHVDVEVKAAEAMPAPDATPEVLFEDIYVRGSEPQFLRGRVPEENFYYPQRELQIPKSPAQT